MNVWRLSTYGSFFFTCSNFGTYENYHITVNLLMWNFVTSKVTLFKLKISIEINHKSIRRFPPAREFFLDHSRPKQTTPRILFNFFNSAFLFCAFDRDTFQFYCGIFQRHAYHPMANSGLKAQNVFTKLPGRNIYISRFTIHDQDINQ